MVSADGGVPVVEDCSPISCNNNSLYCILNIQTHRAYTRITPSLVNLLDDIPKVRIQLSSLAKSYFASYMLGILDLPKLCLVISLSSILIRHRVFFLSQSYYIQLARLETSII